jgi:lysine 2,3-aminomutase
MSGFDKPIIQTSDPFRKVGGYHHTRTIYYGEVISIDDPTDGGRIKVKIPDLDNQTGSANMVSREKNVNATKAKWERGFQYIETHKEIRDVIVSGGDPLTLRDDQIEYILKRLHSIEHVEMIRIGTKVPVVLPMRITKELCDILKKYHPLYMSIHFTHPDELTEETQLACNMLADAGIPLGSQTVLLKGINDNVEIMKKLNQGLLKIRVRPYYIYQMDKIKGAKHFETTIEKGIEIIHGLRGWTSGYAVPQFIVDSDIGKMPVNPNYIDNISKNTVVFKNYEGKIVTQYRNYE